MLSYGGTGVIFFLMCPRGWELRSGICAGGRCLVYKGNRRRFFILAGKSSCVGDKPQKHRNLAFDTDLPINIPCVRLHSARCYAQMLGYVAISETLADEFRNLPLARSQTVPVLYI